MGAKFTAPVDIGKRELYSTGFARLCVGSARLFGYQHVGIRMALGV